MKKYRIITDVYAGFEVQEKSLFFWSQSENKNGNWVNTHSSLEKAKEHIEFLKNKKINKKNKVVYTE